VKNPPVISCIDPHTLCRWVVHTPVAQEALKKATKAYVEEVLWNHLVRFMYFGVCIHPEKIEADVSLELMKECIDEFFDEKFKQLKGEPKMKKSKPAKPVKPAKKGKGCK
jgi:hypothetical protein